MIPEAITGDQFSSSPSTHLRRSLGRQHRGSVKGQRRWGADDVVYLLLIFSFFKKIYRKDVGVFNPKRLNPADQEDAVNAQKDDDDLRRNVDVMEILRKMRFPRVNGANDEKSPKTTLEHDRIIWLGDLNYRITLPYRSAKALVEMQNWRALLEKDHL